MAANRYVYEQPWQENAKFTNADFSRMYLDAPTKIGPAITFMLGSHIGPPHVVGNPTVGLTCTLASTKP